MGRENAPGVVFGELFCAPDDGLDVLGEEGDFAEDVQADAILFEEVSREKHEQIYQDNEELETHPCSQSSVNFVFARFMSVSTSVGERLKFSIENA